MKNKIYPRPHDKQTVYLKDVVTGTNIEVGDYTIYNDFVNDPRDFEKKQCAVPLPGQRRQAHYRKILLYRLRRKVYVHKREPFYAVAFELHLPHFL